MKINPLAVFTSLAAIAAGTFGYVVTQQPKMIDVAKLTSQTTVTAKVETPVAEVPKAAAKVETPVVEVPARDRIRREDLEALDLRDDLRVLLKTRMSGQLRVPEFQEDFVHLTGDAAAYLAQAGLKLVGIDYLSVDRFGTTEYEAHQALLGAGIVIVEGLDLSEVEPGEYEMLCLPLRIVGADGAPARVVLRSRS